MSKKIVLKTGEKLEVQKEDSRYYFCDGRKVRKSGELFKEEIVEKKKVKEKSESKKED